MPGGPHEAASAVTEAIRGHAATVYDGEIGDRAGVHDGSCGAGMRSAERNTAS